MLWRIGPDAKADPEDVYRFGAGLLVSIRGDARARAHFRAEYAPAAVPADSTVPGLEATIGAQVHRGRSRRGTDEAELRGAHKLARWRASVPIASDVNPLRVVVDVRGPLGLALVQSYLVEPLVSLAAVRAESVLLPSAAIALDGKALLLIGRSRSGKSSLAARALAAGRRILGDDQVLITPSQDCLSFPRRLRLYPDLVRTAPTAFATLTPSARGALIGLNHVRVFSRGFVAPPLRVSASTLGAGISPMRLPVGEAVVIRRAPVDGLTFEQLDRGELETEAEDVLLSQREEIFSLAGVRAAFAPLIAKEREMIACALAGAPARRVLVPDRWSAGQAVGTLAHELGLER